MLEDVPRHGPGLADELRRVGGEIRQAAERELAGLYPADLDGSTPIAYLWARTVLCEAPSCGAEIPLLRSLWLAKKAVFRRERGERIKVRGRQALRYRIVRAAKGPPRVEWEVFEPATDKDVRDGTVTRAKAACPCCGAVLPPERVRVQLSEQRGGADMIFDGKGRRIGGARMTAVVTLKENEPGRRYRLPTDADYAAVHEAQARLAGILDEWERGGRQGLCPVPDEPISLNEIRRISVPIYGMTTWGDLFTARQKVVLVELLLAIRKTDVVDTEHMLACAFNRISMSNMSCTRWNAVAEKMQHTFGRQALPIVWDFAEIAVTAEAPGNWKSGYCLVADVVDAARSMQSAQTQFADAIEHPLPDEAAGVWFTDPPYYDAVPYAHLSDFFFVWLKRAVPEQMMTLCNLVDPQDLTPKEREIVVDRPHRLSTSTKTAETYESGMARAFTEGRRILHQDGIGSVVFAHKTTEGWEALLTGIISGGWTITGSWPVATEMGSRLNARDTASLATSVHLVCRPRPDDAPVGDWADVLRELPRRVGDWMERLQGEGVRGADLVFACIGPALEIFSRYSVVETPEGAEVRLPVYLERVWEVVGRTALETVLGAGEAKARNGQVGALEEDARLTALFLWTLQSTEDPEENDAKEARDEEGNEAGRGLALPFDVVRRFAQPMGIDLDAWTDRIIGQDKGVVRLLPVLERAQRLFGEDGAGAAAEWIEADPGGAAQLDLFPSAQARPRSRRHRRRKPSIVEDGAEASGGRRDDAGSRPCGHAPPGKRSRQCAQDADRRGAGTRPGLPAARQLALGPVLERQRGEAVARRDAAGGPPVTRVLSCRPTRGRASMPTALRGNGVSFGRGGPAHIDRRRFCPPIEGAPPILVTRIRRPHRSAAVLPSHLRAGRPRSAGRAVPRTPASVGGAVPGTFAALIRPNRVHPREPIPRRETTLPVTVPRGSGDVRRLLIYKV